MAVDMLFPWCAPAPLFYDQGDQLDVDRRYGAEGANVTKDDSPVLALPSCTAQPWVGQE